jgi:hypothetical protein
MSPQLWHVYWVSYIKLCGFFTSRISLRPTESVCPMELTGRWQTGHSKKEVAQLYLPDFVNHQSTILDYSRILLLLPLQIDHQKAVGL